MITNKDLRDFAVLTRLACYDFLNKGEYKKLGKKILKEIVKQLSLPKNSYEIRWNPGGPAGSGDHILHTDKFYLNLGDNCGFGWFFGENVMAGTIIMEKQIIKYLGVSWYQKMDLMI